MKIVVLLFVFFVDFYILNLMEIDNHLARI